MMRFFYFGPTDIQVPRVERQMTVAFCSALAELGVTVELVAMRVRVQESEPVADDPLTLYRIPATFDTQLIMVPVHQTSGRTWTAINRFSVHLRAVLRILNQFSRADEQVVLYVKNYSTLWSLLAIRRLVAAPALVVFEAHVPPGNLLQRLGLERTDRIVANTHALARDLVRHWGLSGQRVMGTHQGVDRSLVDQARQSKAAARTRVGLPLMAKIIVYTGKIYYGYKEIEYLLEAAKLLEDKGDILFVLVGGRADHVERYRARTVAEGRRNVRFTGFVPPSTVLTYQFAGDVLVLYYPSGISLNQYRSPGKLFEYMAVGRPIVSVDLPVLREVLGNEPAAVMVPPDSPRMLSAQLLRVLDDFELSQGLATKAASRVREFSWHERARKILEFISE